jgi:dihydrofolate synthase/folylpolyglutamate synthase
MNYQEATEYLLNRLPMFQKVGGAAFKAGLERITELCKVLGNPQHQYKTIHIAGTNGKGSCSHFLASILQESGYKTGLTTSPHLQSFTERIRINGQEIEKESFVHFIEKYKQVIEEVEASFFEATIAMAFWYFAEKQVEVAVIETGLGGRLDATNIIRPEVCLITNIGFDHQQFLGNTLPLIASEKAGIIKKEIPVVISEHNSETKQVFLEKASQENAPIYFASEDYEVGQATATPHGLQVTINKKRKNGQGYARQYVSGLLGRYQLKNILGVLSVVDILREKQWIIGEQSLQKGLANVVKNTNLKGRWQILQQKPLVVADTAHNSHGIKEVVEQLKSTPHQQLHLVLGFMKDKEIDNILPLYPQEAIFYFCKPNLPRAMETAVLEEKAKMLNLQYYIVPEVNEALAYALQKAQNEDIVLVGGSTFVVAEIKNL